jgi:Fe2+ or Zn2+ uptake regulation protein
MTSGIELAAQLRSRGFRVTSQRMAVLRVLRHSRSHLSPSQIFERARQKLPGLTETTVYRTLDFLARNGLAWPVHMDKGHLVYELAGSQHHHVICRACGDEIEVEHGLLKKMVAKLEAASGYRLTEDHITLFGLCPICQKDHSRKGS